MIRTLEAGFTVEAALVLPIFLLSVAGIMKLGINMCVETCGTIEMTETEFDAVKEFREIEILLGKMEN